MIDKLYITKGNVFVSLTLWGGDGPAMGLCILERAKKLRCLLDPSLALKAWRVP